MSKPTPGPWRYERRGNDRYIVTANGESLFCDMQYYPWCSDEEADWPLIAAAPDLLEYALLQEKRSRAERPDHGCEWCGECCEKLHALRRAAIAKAEGREP